VRASTPLSALRGRSKSRGFDASDLQMVSKALDMAVAIGGGIAGAIQRSGEDDRAPSRGSTGGGYLLPPGTDARILEDRRARRAAAEDATGGEVSGDVEAFFAQQTPDARDRLPGLGSEFTLDSPLVQQRPTPAGPLSPGVLAMPGSLAPEDISALRSTAQLMQHQSNMAQQMAAAEALDPNRPVGRPGVPARLFTHPESPQADFGARLRAQAPDIGRPNSSQLLYGDDPEVAAALGAAPARRMLAPPLAQYAPQSAPPVPQAPPMPMATPQPQFIPGGGQANALGRRLPSSMGRLMAMAPFVRTQADADRLMQAVATSPDVQPSTFDDWVSNKHVQRAQAQVAALMPKGLGRGPKPVTALDMARLEQTRERTELIRMQQKMAQAKLDEEAAELVRQAERLKGGNTRAKKMGALVDQSVFFLQNYKARSEGDMDDATWSAGAGQFAGDRPESVVAHAQRLKLPRRSIAAIRGGAPMLLRRAPTDPPPPRVLMSQPERRLRQNSIVKHDTDAAEAGGNVMQLQGYLTKTPRELKALSLTREGIKNKIEEQKNLAGIAKRAAKSNRDALQADREAREQGTTSAPSGAVYNAATGQYE